MNVTNKTTFVNRGLPFPQAFLNVGFEVFGRGFSAPKHPKFTFSPWLSAQNLQL